MHGGKLFLRIVHFLGELRFCVGKLLPGIVHTLGKLCLRLAYLLGEFAVRFLYTVGQVGQTNKRGLGQLLSQLGLPARADGRVPRAPWQDRVRCVRIRSHR